MSTEAILQSLSRVPPLWELDQFVAVNPFVGHTQRSFREVLFEREALTGVPHLPGDGQSFVPSRAPIDTVSAVLGPFLGSYFSPSSTLLRAPWADSPLWQAWKSSLPGSSCLSRKESRKLHRFVKDLPIEPIDVVDLLAPEEDTSGWMDSLLSALPGWASYLRRLQWPTEVSADGPLTALAAMLASLHAVVPRLWSTHPAAPSGFDQRLARLEEREAALRGHLRAQLAPTLRGPEAAPPLVKAAFCIDVRSEPFRRAWESADQRVETDGFAGFFGLPLGWVEGEKRQAHLPVLLSPSRFLKAPGPQKRFRKVLASAGTPNFPMVEVTGWAAGWKLAARIRPKSPARLAGVEAALADVPVGEQASWAHALLKNLGWTRQWAPLMAFVGHGSSSLNNPHAAGLDCGACGGRTGELSARIAAAMLNHAGVRQELAARGWAIPPQTWFVGGLHNTTLDTVEWYAEALPPEAQVNLKALEPGLASARQAVQREKAQRFPFLRGPQGAADEAETRPEAALAGNAAFVVAPRSLTRGKSLEGRSFLHTYDPDGDADGTILELILTAPAVVASWINLQYFASTVTPELYGGGDKVLHSRLGSVGVYEGNRWDLKVGLPRQSVSWGGRDYHEALRLQVLVTAPLQRVQTILDKHPTVASLFDQGWVDLSVGDESGHWHRRRAGDWFNEPQPWDAVSDLSLPAEEKLTTLVR